MATTVNRMTDDWMQERSQAPLDKMKDWVVTCARELGAPLVDAVQDRIGVAAAGKRMLDEGGEAAELGVLAKKVAIDAVALDNDIIDRIQNAVELYSEAAKLLQIQTSGLGVLGRLVEAYTERSNVYSKILEQVGEAPNEPPMTDVEWDAIKFVQLRQAKAQLGLREQVGGSKAGRHGSSLFNCLDDGRAQGSIGGAQASLENQLAPQLSNKASQCQKKIEELMQELFRLQDLKGDGVLEEDEVIKLNEKIAMLHYGKDVDKNAVREKFRALFRARLDADGRPVAYPRFREYMVQVLNEVDTDPRAQEMILEQFVAEAQSARDIFHYQSFASASDFPFTRPGGVMPNNASGAPAPRILESMPEEAPVSSSSLTPSVTDWTVGGHEGPVGNEGPVGGSMASKVMSMGQLDQECEPSPLPRGDTLDTLNTVIDTLDAHKAVIEAIEPPQTLPRDNTLDTVNTVASSASNAPAQADSSVSPRCYASKDAEKQAASRRILQEARGNTPPKTSPNRSFDIGSSAPPAEASLQRPPPSDTTRMISQEASFPGPYPGLNASATSHAASTNNAAMPGMFPSATSYAIGTGGASALGSHPSATNAAGNAGSSRPASACPYKAGAPVEIFSKSANMWVRGSVSKVDGWLLTVQYGDRERKVDLKAHVSDFFRSAQQHAVTSAPAFDSMLTNPGGTQSGNVESEISVEPRHIKPTVL